MNLKIIPHADKAQERDPRKQTQSSHHLNESASVNIQARLLSLVAFFFCFRLVPELKHVKAIINPLNTCVPWTPPSALPLAGIMKKNEKKKIRKFTQWLIRLYMQYTQNHRVVWDGRDLQDHLVPTPALHTYPKAVSVLTFSVRDLTCIVKPLQWPRQPSAWSHWRPGEQFPAQTGGSTQTRSLPQQQLGC